MVPVTALGRLRQGVSEEQAATEVRTNLQRNPDTSPASAALLSGMRAARGGRAAGGGAAGGGAAGDTPEVDAQVLSLREEMVGGYRPALLALTVATALVLLMRPQQRGGPAAGARGHAPAGPGGLRGARRGPGPHRETAPDRERGAEPDRRRARAGGGHPGDPRRAGDGPGRYRTARRGDGQRRGARVHPRLSVVVGWRSARCPPSSGRGSSWCVPQRGERAGHGRLPAAALGPHTSALATAQVALAVVLLVGAGLLLRSFRGLMTVERGYDPDNVNYRPGPEPRLYLEDGRD